MNSWYGRKEKKIKSMLHNEVANIPRTLWYSRRDLYAKQDSILLVSTCYRNIYAFRAHLNLVFSYKKFLFKSFGIY